MCGILFDKGDSYVGETMKNSVDGIDSLQFLQWEVFRLIRIEFGVED